MQNNNIEITGKIIKFPKNTKAVKALQFLENVKVNPNKLWYIIIESQDNELKMVKYNRAQGVNLLTYTENLKNFYLNTIIDENIKSNIEKIEVVGENDFSIIKNIPHIILENNKTLLSKITSDLIKLLAD